jgi:hypothetical protein
MVRNLFGAQIAAVAVDAAMPLGPGDGLICSVHRCKFFGSLEAVDELGSIPRENLIALARISALNAADPQWTFSRPRP